MVETPPLRVVFFGTPSFAVPTLDALLSSRHAVIAVVTQPDRPRGRGQRTTASPVKERAVAAGVTVLQPQIVKTHEFAAALSALNADIAIVAAYGQILTEQLLAAPRLGMINVHASLLPRYRGAAPIHRSVIAGDSSTGVTIMRMVRALDAGAMIATEHAEIGEDDTSVDLEDRLARLGAGLLVRTLDDIAAGRAHETPQDDSAATYAPRLSKDDSRVDWSRNAFEIHNLIRGLHPWPHAVTFASGARLILHQSHPTGRTSTDPPGTILEAAADRLTIATGDGALDLLEIQVEGKRPMHIREFLTGHPLTPGTRLQPSP